MQIAKTLLLMAALAPCVTPARAAHAFTLSSPTFRDGERMPKAMGGSPAGGPNCKGENAGPQLSWANAPPGTKSFAFTVFDPDAGAGRGLLHQLASLVRRAAAIFRSGAGTENGFVHWVAYGIPPDVTSFAAGEIAKPSDKYVGGANGAGVATYGGPCPPEGAPHHYVFTIVATDLDPKALPPGLTYAQLQQRLEGHRKGVASIVGTYANPYER